jgi:hypothetical protein
MSAAPDNSEILSLNEQKLAVAALMKIAKGYVINGSGNRQRLGRDQQMSVARQAIDNLGLTWEPAKDCVSLADLHKT